LLFLLLAALKEDIDEMPIATFMLDVHQDQVMDGICYVPFVVVIYGE
jgi:hypothetical protein